MTSREVAEQEQAVRDAQKAAEIAAMEAAARAYAGRESEPAEG